MIKINYDIYECLAAMYLGFYSFYEEKTAIQILLSGKAGVYMVSSKVPFLLPIFMPMAMAMPLVLLHHVSI